MAIYRDRSKLLPIILVAVIAVIAIVAMVSIGRAILNRGDSAPVADDPAERGLLTTGADRSVRMSVRGPIVAEEDFRSYEIEVSPISRRMTVFQGTEADLMKMTMLKIDTALSGSSAHSGVQDAEKNSILPAESRASRSTAEPLGHQLLQIHDSILVEAPEGNADKVSGILKDTMESICPDLDIRLEVDVTAGKDWGSL